MATEIGCVYCRVVSFWPSSNSPSRFVCFNVVANDTWLIRAAGVLNDVDSVLRKAGIAEAVRRRSVLVCKSPVILLAHGLTIPKARHITKARLLDVLEFALPELLRTRIAAGPSSTTASRVSPDVVATSSPTWLTLSALSSTASCATALTFVVFTGFLDFVLRNAELWNFGFTGSGNTPPVFPSVAETLGSGTAIPVVTTFVHD